MDKKEAKKNDVSKEVREANQNASKEDQKTNDEPKGIPEVDFKKFLGCGG